MTDTCPTCGQPVRVEPSEEKIRAAFEEATEPGWLDKDNVGDYLDSDVWCNWIKFKTAYLAGWKDRGGK